MLEFQRYTLVRFLTLITSVMQFCSLTSGHGFTHVSMDTTQNGRNLLTIFTQTGMGLEECTLSCSLRPKCFSLGYERITGHCELYSELSVDQPVLQTEKQRRRVIYVERTDITSEAKASCDTLCSAGADPRTVCDLQETTCVIEDCIPIRSPDHASVLGNDFVNGSVASYTCKAPAVPLGDDRRMECRNGVWSKGPVCAVSALQSSTYQHGVASRAIDGIYDSHFLHGSCTHTYSTTRNYWALELNTMFSVENVILQLRTDCCVKRNAGLTIYVSQSLDEVTNDGGHFCGKTDQDLFLEDMLHPVVVSCPSKPVGKYISVVQQSNETMPLSICELSFTSTYLGL